MIGSTQLTPLPTWAKEHKWGRVGLAALSALLLAFAYPLVHQWWLAWIALTPLYLVLATAPHGKDLPGGVSARCGGWAGFWFGFVLHIAGSYWMLILGSVPWIVLAAIEATPFAAFGVVMAWLLPRLAPRLRPIAFAFGWVVLEWARYQGKLAFPWFPLAATQAPVPLMLQILSITGQWGIAFAIAFSGAYFGEAWLKPGPNGKGRRIRLRWFAPLKVMTVVALLGLLTTLVDSRLLRTEGKETRRIGIAQGSEEDSGQAPNTYMDLSRDLARGSDRPLDLVAWPETSLLKADVLHDPFVRPRVSALAQSLGTPFLVGSEVVQGRDRYNSAALFEADGNYGKRYDKQQLVPMGEFFLLRSLLGSIYENYQVPATDMTPGTKVGLFTTGRMNETGSSLERPFRVGVMICYESAFPSRARDCVREGAQVLCLLTSDWTFGQTAGPRQHADMSVLRAIETRRYVVRAALTGTSEFVAPSGKVEQSLGLMQRGTLAQDVTLQEGETLYTRLGDWFVWLAFGFSLFFIGKVVLSKTKQATIKT